MTDAPIHVRDGMVTDAHALAAIRIRAWRAAYDGIVPAPILASMDLDRNAAFFAARAGTPGGRETLVIEDATGILSGYALTGPCADNDATGLGEIQAIYLDPDARGRGLGATLLAAALTRLSDAGFPAAVLWVLTANGPARRFYERHGFVPDGAARMLDFDGTPIEEIRYRRTRVEPSTIGR
ncbi:MAG: GNAT family N-acetyltransferase [Chloroflexi bacterium]|nr:GNAT family N-acetyltransferase [Chloroflexota bacterium]